MKHNSTIFQLDGIERKQVLKNLKKIARQLPLTYYKAMAYSYRKGKDILDDQSLSTIHSTIINEQAWYKVEYETMHPVNHVKRMKSLLKKGVWAVQKYILEMQKFAREMAKNELPFVIHDMDLWIKAHIIKDFLDTKKQRRKRRRA